MPTCQRLSATLAATATTASRAGTADKASTASMASTARTAPVLGPCCAPVWSTPRAMRRVPRSGGTWRVVLGLGLAGLVWLVPAVPGAQAAPAGSPGAASASAPGAAARRQNIQAAYEADRAACLDQQRRAQRGQALAPCLKEAGAVRTESLRLPMSAASAASSLDGGAGATSTGAAEWQANRRKRCEPLPLAQRADCRRLADGEGTVEGSVAGGGVLKTLTTRSVAPLPTASAPAGG